MPSITTQNIASASAQIRPNETATASAQDNSRNTNRSRTELTEASRIVAEKATISPDGGPKSRASDSEKRVSNTFNSARKPEDEGDHSKPSSAGTGRRLNLTA